jgi:hypothetical protein
MMASNGTNSARFETVPSLPWLLRVPTAQLLLLMAAIAAVPFLVLESVKLQFSSTPVDLVSPTVAIAVCAFVFCALLLRLRSRIAAQRHAIDQRLLAIVETNERTQRVIELIRISAQSAFDVQAINSIVQNVNRIRAAAVIAPGQHGKSAVRPAQYGTWRPAGQDLQVASVANGTSALGAAGAVAKVTNM